MLEGEPEVLRELLESNSSAAEQKARELLNDEPHLNEVVAEDKALD